MSQPYRSFLVVKTGTMGQLLADGQRLTAYQGGPYTEDSLREWAMETFDTDEEEATLEDIARDISADGWLLYEGVGPSGPWTGKSMMQRIAEIFLGDLEVDADSIAEACKGIGQRVNAKTVIAEVKGNEAVITITVTPKED